MTVLLGDIAPDFDAKTTIGPISFHDWIDGSWAVLFSHPADFTPVCTTELAAVARLLPQFEERNVKVAAVSVDPLDKHEAWKADIEKIAGRELGFPLVADPDREISTAYGMIHPSASATATVRSVFVIGPDKQVKLTLTYPASTGRDFGELLRVIDSLQLTAEHQLATPADWRAGDDVVITPAVSDEEAIARFGEYDAVTPYLRIVPAPVG